MPRVLHKSTFKTPHEEGLDNAAKIALFTMNLQFYSGRSQSNLTLMQCCTSICGPGKGENQRATAHFKWSRIHASNSRRHMAGDQQKAREKHTAHPPSRMLGGHPKSSLNAPRLHLPLVFCVMLYSKDSPSRRLLERSLIITLFRRGNKIMQCKNHVASMFSLSITAFLWLQPWHSKLLINHLYSPPPSYSLSFWPQTSNHLQTLPYPFAVMQPACKMGGRTTGGSGPARRPWSLPPRHFCWLSTAHLGHMLVNVLCRPG